MDKLKSRTNEKAEKHGQALRNVTVVGDTVYTYTGENSVRVDEPGSV